MGSDKASSARLLLALADLAGNVRELPVELLSELLPLLPPELLPRTAEAVLRIPDTLRAAPLLIGVAARASAELRRRGAVQGQGALWCFLRTLSLRPVATPICVTFSSEG